MSPRPSSEDTLKALIGKLDELRVTTEYKFVPWKSSRNKDQSAKSLNWKVTIKRGAMLVVETDYMAGCGHCPAYNKVISAGRDSNERHERAAMVEFECDTGFEAGGRMAAVGGIAAKMVKNPETLKYHKVPLFPDLRDLWSSLLGDAQVLDHPDFESWAVETGSNPDSRSAEKVYRECLSLGLKLHSNLGLVALTELREILKDW